MYGRQSGPQATHIISSWRADTRDSPFALPIDLMLREGDILMVNVDPKVESDLPQVLISRPL